VKDLYTDVMSICLHWCDWLWITLQLSVSQSVSHSVRLGIEHFWGTWPDFSRW